MGHDFRDWQGRKYQAADPSTRRDRSCRVFGYAMRTIMLCVVRNLEEFYGVVKVIGGQEGKDCAPKKKQ